MPLKSSTAAAAVPTREGGVRFEMLHGKQAVTVRVSDQALADLDQGLVRREGGLLAVFWQHRDRIEQAAAHKYRAKRLEVDGSISLGSTDFPRR